jgi:hypothetical protein
MRSPPSVTIVGGGIAGLSAALRLAQRGYPVKIYERSERLGGNLGSRSVDGRQLDIYPHMYLNWYHNFWSLLGDATGNRPQAGFTPCSTVWQLRRGDYPRFRGITDAYSPWNPPQVLANLLSGVVPPADMFLFGYGSSDLLAERFRTTAIDQLSVTAFLRSRPYMTDRALAAYNSFITMVWSLPAYLTSAADFQTYLAHCVADPTPAFWLPRGSAQARVIGPLHEALTLAGAEIVTGVQLLDVACRSARAQRLTLQHARFDEALGRFVGEGAEWTEDVDELVLAVTAPELSRLVRSGPPGESMVDFKPEAADLSRLQALPIPILHVYFTRRLPSVPAEPVGLVESSLALAFTDISQTWDGLADTTVLALSASDPHGLPGTSWKDDAMKMLRQLAEYLGFDAGAEWGASADIDWDCTCYHANTDAQLFVNQIGTDSWRPAVRTRTLENVCFAGDFCRNRVGLTTIEAAATGGVEAAASIVARHGIGEPVEVQEPRSLPAALHAWLRTVWMPYACGAKMWSSGGDTARTLGDHLRGML